MPQPKSNLARRLSALERIHPPPLTAAAFLARVQSASRTFGDEAFNIVARQLSDADLARLQADLELVAFGDDHAAAEAFYREIGEDSDALT